MFGFSSKRGRGASRVMGFERRRQPGVEERRHRGGAENHADDRES